jgi:hypothetical protein
MDDLSLSYRFLSSDRIGDDRVRRPRYSTPTIIDHRRLRSFLKLERDLPASEVE